MSLLDDLNALPDDSSADAPAFSFKDLLAEAVAHKADGDKLKAVRKSLKSGASLSAEEAADLRRMENAREWLPRASVAMFNIQHCTGCENYAAMFTGLFQRQASRHSQGVSRWVSAAESENYGLKQEVKTTETDIPFCCFCLTEWGFPGDQLGIVFDEDAADEAEAEGEPSDDLPHELPETCEAQMSFDFDENPV